MKSLYHDKGLLHVETPLGIVNITVGLRDSYGREVESIRILESNYAGERKVHRRGGSANIILVQNKK